MTIEQRTGKQIAAARKGKGITQSKLSELSGVSQGDISDIESGKQNATIHRIGRLLEALGYTIDLLAE